MRLFVCLFVCLFAFAKFTSILFFSVCSCLQVVLPSSQDILLIGGYNENDVLLQRCELFSNKHNQWLPFSNMPLPARECVAAVVLVLEDKLDKTSSARVEPAAQNHSTTSAPHGNEGNANENDMDNDNSKSSDAESENNANGASLKSENCAPTHDKVEVQLASDVVAVVVVVGGWDGTSSLNDALAFSTAKQQWHHLAPMQQARNRPCAAVLHTHPE